MPRPGAVLLTRPEPDSQSVAAELAPIPALIWPLMRVELLPAVLPDPTGAALVFTSRNAVAGWVAAGGGVAHPCWCVGAATRAAAEAAGFRACRDGGGTAESLAACIRGASSEPLLHVRGAEVARDLPALLAPDGPPVSEVVVYRTVATGPPPQEIAAALAAGGVALVTVWSPRAARILAPWLTASVPCLAISDAAAEPLRARSGPVHVAERPDRAAMLASIRALAAPEGGT